MAKTIIICDICKRVIVDGEKFDIDVKIRHTAPTDKRRGFARVDMCRACYDNLIDMCKKSRVEEMMYEEA